MVLRAEPQHCQRLIHAMLIDCEDNDEHLGERGRWRRLGGHRGGHCYVRGVVGVVCQQQAHFEAVQPVAFSTELSANILAINCRRGPMLIDRGGLIVCGRIIVISFQ